jgi:hypothetical protein
VDHLDIDDDATADILARWMLDGFDSAIYIFVLVPALTDLLHADGIAPEKGAIALYGGYLFTVFMLGWACSMFLELARRLHRTRERFVP